MLRGHSSEWEIFSLWRWERSGVDSVQFSVYAACSMPKPKVLAPLSSHVYNTLCFTTSFTKNSLGFVPFISVLLCLHYFVTIGNPETRVCWDFVSFACDKFFVLLTHLKMKLKGSSKCR